MSSPDHKEEMIAEEDQSKKIEEEQQNKKMEEDQSKKMEEEQHKETVVEHSVDDATTATVIPPQTNTEIIQKPAESAPVVVSAALTKVYNYGSNEMDQFWLPDERSETRRPYLNALMNNITVAQVACGSLHILILTHTGLVYSSGQNDDGALGRRDETSTDEESDKKSKLVELPLRVNMISAGDSHSVAANSELGVCFQWGTYRNTEKSNLAPPTRLPVRVGEKEFAKKKFQKVLSGQQHTLVLTQDGEVFAWGDPDMGVVGRMPRTRHGYEQALRIAKISHQKAVDIYTGGRHSFLKRLLKKGVPASEGVEEQKPIYACYAWGLNNFGQLGLDKSEEDHHDVYFEPTRMEFFDNLEVKAFCGGESHSLALLTDGSVYAFGRNDIGQAGIGKIKEIHPIYGEIKEMSEKPLKIDSFQEKISAIWSGSNYCYARNESGQCYSWGFGSNFVLGNRKDVDEDEFKPYAIPHDFLKNEIPFQFALGSQHVTYLVSLDSQDHPVPKEILLDAPEEFLPIHLRPKTTALSRAVAEKEINAIKRAEQLAKKTEEAAKKAEEAAKKTEEAAAKKAGEAAKKAEEAAKKKEVEEAAKKKEVEKKKDEQKAKKDIPKDSKPKSKSRSQSANKKTVAVQKHSNAPVRSASKSKAVKAPVRAVSKSRSQSKERVKQNGKKPTTPQTSSKKATNGVSNKKKLPEEDHVKVSQAKNTKQLKKVPASKNK